jgi:hypothetical protein
MPLRPGPKRLNNQLGRRCCAPLGSSRISGWPKNRKRQTRIDGGAPFGDSLRQLEEAGVRALSRASREGASVEK